MELPTRPSSFDPVHKGKDIKVPASNYALSGLRPAWGRPTEGSAPQSKVQVARRQSTSIIIAKAETCLVMYRMNENLDIRSREAWAHRALLQFGLAVPRCQLYPIQSVEYEYSTRSIVYVDDDLPLMPSSASKATE